MFAIIETGGKQYKVQEGDVIKVEKLDVDAGSSYVFDKVLAILEDGGSAYGRPYVGGASVTADVLGSGRGKKVIVYKYKPKKTFHKKKGHRQPFTELKITAVNK